MIRFAALLLFAATAWASPVKAPQRVIFHTLAGDLVLALYPEVAPKTVAQFLNLVRHGVFDSGHFRRLEPGFVIQTGVADDRIIPLSSVQRAVVHKVPAEFSTTLRHRRGTLSMARYDNDVNSAETSFSILLGDAPHLDGKYTIFGEVEAGADVLRILEGVAINADKTPKFRISIGFAEVAETVEGLKGHVLSRPIPLAALSEQVERQLATDRTQGALPLGIVLAVLVVLSTVGALIGRRMKSLLFLNALIGAFALFCWQAPVSKTAPWLGVALFLGSAALFRSLSFFESPPPPARQ